MKKILLSTVLLLVFTVTAQTFAQGRLKIGYIDSNELLQLMPERDSALIKLEAHAKTLERQLITMGTELEKKYNEFMEEQASMSELIRQTRTNELQELQNRIQSFEMSAQEDLGKQEMELLAPIVEKARKAIDKVAKDNGFTYILDVASGAVLYHEGGENILPLVKRELGL